MPRTKAPTPPPLTPQQIALEQQNAAMAGLADFDLPRTVVTRLAKAQVRGVVNLAGRKKRVRLREAVLTLGLGVAG